MCIESPRIRFERREFEVPVENPLYLLAARLGVVQRGDLLVEGRRPSDPAEYVKGAVSIPTEVGRLRIGEVDWLLVPGEIYPEIVFGGIFDPPDPGADFPEAPAEPALFPMLEGKHRAVLGLANDEIGYLIPKRQWDFKPPFAFARRSPQYGETNSRGPEAGPEVTATAQALLRRK